MLASDDEEKCGREGDVADETKNVGGVLKISIRKGKGRKSRNTTPLLGLKTTRLHA